MGDPSTVGPGYTEYSSGLASAETVSRLSRMLNNVSAHNGVRVELLFGHYMKFYGDAPPYGEFFANATDPTFSFNTTINIDFSSTRLYYKTPGVFTHSQISNPHLITFNRLGRYRVTFVGTFLVQPSSDDIAERYNFIFATHNNVSLGVVGYLYDNQTGGAGYKTYNVFMQASFDVADDLDATYKELYVRVLKVSGSENIWIKPNTSISIVSSG